MQVDSNGKALMAHCSYHPGTPSPTCYTCQKLASKQGIVILRPPVEDIPSVISVPPSLPKQPFPFSIQPWDDVSLEQLDRVRLFHWKYNTNSYWRDSLQHTTSDFRRAFPKMLEQCEGWDIQDIPKPKPADQQADPNCPKCHGYGGYPVPSDNLMYKLKDGSSLFQSWEDCDCLKKKK